MPLPLDVSTCPLEPAVVELTVVPPSKTPLFVKEVAPVPPLATGTVVTAILILPVELLTVTGLVAVREATPESAEARVDLRTLFVVPALMSTIARTSSSDKLASVSSGSSVIFLLVVATFSPPAKCS